MTDREETYQRAAEIADRLLVAGWPLVGFEAQDAGAKASFAFAGDQGAGPWAFRVPRENLTFEAVEEMVKAYL